MQEQGIFPINGILFINKIKAMLVLYGEMKANSSVRDNTWHQT